MSSFVSFAAGSAPANLDNTYEALGFGSDGTGTNVTANAAGHTKGSFVSLGTSTADYAGFMLWIGPGTSSARYLLDIRAGASTVIVPNLYVHTGSIIGWRSVFIPLNVLSGTELHCAVQASGTGGLSCYFAIVGVLRNSQSAPLFSSMVALSVDTTNTRASTVSVPLTDTWTTLLASTAATYGGLLAVTGVGSSNPGTAQASTVFLGTGVAASEVGFYQYPIVANGTDPRLPSAYSGLIAKSISSGTRIAGKIDAATSGDNFGIGLYGLIA